MEKKTVVIEDPDDEGKDQDYSGIRMEKILKFWEKV